MVIHGDKKNWRIHPLVNEMNNHQHYHQKSSKIINHQYSSIVISTDLPSVNSG